MRTVAPGDAPIVEAPAAAPRTAPKGPSGRGPARTRLASRRVRRNRILAAVTVALLGALLAVSLRGTPAMPSSAAVTHPSAHPGASTRLEADWDGDGEPVRLVFAGDSNFPAGSTLGDRLAADPATALGPGAHELLSHADLAMVNFESSMTFGGRCPDPQPKQYVFAAPVSALTAFRSAGATLVTEANNHGEDCGRPGLLEALTLRARAHYRVLGIGANAAQAFTSYQTVLHGEHVGIIAATQVIDDDLIPTWTATSTQPGLASAYETTELLHAVRAARRIDDTVVVFLHWGVQLDACPTRSKSRSRWPWCVPARTS